MDALQELRNFPDAQIHDALTQNEWRVALQMIEKKEKKLKKGRSDDWLAASKASLLLMLPEPTKQRQGRTLLDLLLEKSPPIVDLNALVVIETLAEQRKESDPRINALWLKAANAQPKDEQLYKHWFRTRFCSKDWQNARKAATTYSRNFSSRREPFFWTILVNYMIAKSKATSQQEKQLCGTMACRMIEKAAADVPFNADKVGRQSHYDATQDPNTETEKELNNSGRVLRTPSDITFLLDVYESQEKYDEALDVLESDRTGIKSRIGKRSWDLVIRKVRLLGLTGRYLDQFQCCFELLQDAKPNNRKRQVHGFGELGNDWAVWSAMYEAVKNLPSYEVKPVDWYPELASDPDWRESRVKLWVIACLTWNWYQERNRDRNAFCIAMLFHSNSICCNTDQAKNSSSLVLYCADYFKVKGDKSFYFNDIQDYLDGLNLEAGERLLEEAKITIKDRIQKDGTQRDKRNGLSMMKVNLLKLEYYLVISKFGLLKAGAEKEDRILECIKAYGPRSTIAALDQSHHSGDAARLEKFAVKCIALYGSRSMIRINGSHHAERYPEDDAGILAASTLLRLHQMGDHQNALLRATTILQHIISVSPFNYEALVIMTILCTRLGDGWGAAEYYERLAVKNIQLPTMSWLLCTRMSTLHPHSPQLNGSNAPVRRSGDDPVQHLSRALDYHLHIRESDQQEMIGFLEAGKYTSSVDAMKHSDDIQNGFAKYMLFLEFVRTERLSGAPQKLKNQLLPVDLISVSARENRDGNPVPRWEHPHFAPLSETILPGPWITDHWLQHQLFTASVYNLIVNGNSSSKPTEMRQNFSAQSYSFESETMMERRQYMLAVECVSVLEVYEKSEALETARKRNAERVMSNVKAIEHIMQLAHDEISDIDRRIAYHFWSITDNVHAPDWKFFHAIYLGIDNCILAKRTMELVNAENRKSRLLDAQWAAEQTGKIRKMCDEYRPLVHAKVRSLVEEFSGSKHHWAMLNNVVGRPEATEDQDPIAYWLRRTCGELFAQAMVKKLCQGWHEALKNVERLTVANS
ncbi:MAG: hypothetical protein Q9201_003896 [Fulgogasparrea decipioides]